MSIDFSFVAISVSSRPRDYEFIDLVWEKSHDEIRLGEFVKEIPRKEKISVPSNFSHWSITDSKEPQNALLLIVVQNRV